MYAKRLTVILAVLLVFGISCTAAEFKPETTPLFTYVNQADSSYAWSKQSETKLENGATCIKVDLTSQTWHDILWKHELNIIVPKKLRDGSTVAMILEGGKLSQNDAQFFGYAAGDLGMPIAVLGDVPFQPIYGKYEDDLIAETFIRTIETGDLTWPLLFPMTKSVVRAMDAIQALGSKEWGSPVKGFVISGASKRGWTTWMTGAVDKRVVGIAPAVYDCLNMVKQLEHQTKVYGSASAMMAEYEQHGLPEFAMSPQGQEFAKLIDPYSYRRLLTMPKLILLGSNDPYWTLESPNLYVPNLPGDNHIHYSPNQGHVYIDEMDVARALGAFARACSTGEHLPKMTWSYVPAPGGLKITIRPGKDATAVRVWTVAQRSARDFRGAEWKATKLEGKDGVYAYTLSRPKSGYAAIFGEAEYTVNGIPYTQNTTPRVWSAK